MREDFAVFICTHGRPDKQLTVQTLLKCGYTGKWFLVLDDTDITIQQYIDNYGIDHIIVFNKNYYINTARYDNGDNKLHAKCVVYAKRASEDIAKSMGLNYFLLADDDVTGLSFRFPDGEKLRRQKIFNIDLFFEAYINWMEVGNISVLGFGTPSNFFCGVTAFSPDNLIKRPLPYNFTLRSVKHPVNWLSWFAEDSITLYQDSLVGNLWLSALFVMFDCMPIGDTSGNGGMVDIYTDNSSYQLQFNVVKYCPNRIALKPYYKNGKMLLDRRNENSLPKIISGRYKK